MWYNYNNKNLWRKSGVMDEDRLKHSYAVARKMIEIGKKNNFDDEQIKELFVLGLNHDIGYEFSQNGVNHNKIGGEILRDSGCKYWQEVYYHGEVETEYHSVFLNVLNQADMQIDKYGNDVGYEKRLKDIASRYGIESEVYKKCERLVNIINDK